MSEKSKEERFFYVTFNYTSGRENDMVRKIGPYSDKDLTIYGEPPSEDIDRAVWEIITDYVGVVEVE